MKKSIYLMLILILTIGALAVHAQDATPEMTPEMTEMAPLGTAEDLVPSDAEVAAAKTALGSDGFVAIIRLHALDRLSLDRRQFRRRRGWTDLGIPAQ